METRIISAINQKGGVAKTTTVQNLAAALSLLDKKVLVVDCDPQGNFTGLYFDEAAMESKYTIYDLLKEEAKDEESENAIKASDVILHYQNDKVKFDIIPATPVLGQADFELISLPGREFLLKKILSKIVGYDFILLDCPPSLSILTINVLCCSDKNELMILVKPGYFSKMGIKTLNKVRKNLEKKIGIVQKNFKFLVAMFKENRTQHQETVREIEQQFSENHIFETKIRDVQNISSAQECGLDIFNYDPKSNGALDYMNLAKEIIKNA